MIKQNHTSKDPSKILHDCLRGSFSFSLLQWKLFSLQERRNKTAYLAFFPVLDPPLLNMVYKASLEQCETGVERRVLTFDCLCILMVIRDALSSTRY